MEGGWNRPRYYAVESEPVRKNRFPPPFRRVLSFIPTGAGWQFCDVVPSSSYSPAAGEDSCSPHLHLMRQLPNLITLIPPRGHSFYLSSPWEVSCPATT